MSIFAEVLDALIERLSTDAGIVALVGTNVYSGVPQDNPLDYIVARSENAEFDTKGSDGFDSRIVVDIWTGHEGNQKTNIIADAVYEALHNKPLDISVKSLCLQFQNYNVFIEPDDISSHGVMNFLHIYSN